MHSALKSLSNGNEKMRLCARYLFIESEKNVVCPDQMFVESIHLERSVSTICAVKMK